MALIGAAASSALLGIPAVAAVTPKAEDPYDKARRLSRELAKALAEVENHPVAPHAYVAFIQPANGKHEYPFGLVDLDVYEDWRAHTMTETQAAAVAAWQLADIEQRAAWADYLAGKCHRAAWENTTFATHDTMSAMHAAFRS